jgi:DNA-binding FadR family transcriptional regulator
MRATDPSERAERAPASTEPVPAQPLWVAEYASLAEEIADRIRRDVLQSANNEFLGSQDDLVRRYGGSRPTIRQAITLLVQENLLVAKRGPSGGYFVRRSDTESAVRGLAVYLRSRNAQLTELLQAIVPLNVEMAKLAARSRDPVAKERLFRFIAPDDALVEPDFATFFRGERAFQSEISAIGGSVVFSTLLKVLTDFLVMSPRDDNAYVLHLDRVSKYKTKRNLLIGAVIDGDEELAALAAAQRASIAAEWVKASVAQRAASEVAAGG